MPGCGEVSIKLSIKLQEAVDWGRRGRTAVEERAVDDDHGAVVRGEGVRAGVFVVQDCLVWVVYCYCWHRGDW